jgi:hypothetical protein
MARKKQHTKSPGTKRRLSLTRKRSSMARVPKGSLVVELATATGTDKVVQAALKAAHGWDDETRLTREEFVQAHDAWLAAPGRARRRNRKVTR